MQMNGFFAVLSATSKNVVVTWTIIVEQYLTTVKPMHYLYVEPTRALADVVINSGMNDVAFDVVRSKIQLMLEEE